MDRDQLLEQAQEVVDAHPDLCLVPGDDGVVLSGKYILDGIYNGVPYYEEFNLEIRIPWGYPEKLPSVKELDNRIKKSKYGHIFVGDELCLGARCDLIDRLQACNSLLEYLDMVISSYLFGFLYIDVIDVPGMPFDLPLQIVVAQGENLIDQGPVQGLYRHCEGL